MTAITFDSAPRLAMVASKLQSFISKLSEAHNASTMHRMQLAMPESERRRERVLAIAGRATSTNDTEI